MFANQVLRVIDSYIKKVKISLVKVNESKFLMTTTEYKATEENFTDKLVFLEKMKTKLNNAVHFYLGNYASWSESIGKMLKEQTTGPFYKKNRILPFPICSFSYSLYKYVDVIAIVECVLMNYEQSMVSDFPSFIIHYCVRVKGYNNEEWFPVMFSHNYALEHSGKDLFPQEILNDITQPPETESKRHDLGSSAALFLQHATTNEKERTFYNKHNEMLKDSIFVVSIALKYLQCKNVTTEYTYMTKSSKEFNRIEKDKKELFRYKTLKVMVPKNRKVYVYDKKEPKMTTMPVHIVMAHEKTYTEERPLFGKHVGSWLWQDFTRGDPENGFVTKDYCIKQK